MRANYHTHCDFCDGKAPAAEMARAAREAGFDILGFSSHAPILQPMPWALRPERLGEYAAEIRRLKAAWAPDGEEARERGPMEILLGLEIDWFPGERKPGDGAFDALGLDFSIGSVHYVAPRGCPPFAVDAHREGFDACFAASGATARELYRDYYGRLSALIGSGGFDILGHFDLVQKNNMDGRLFEEEPDYLAAAFGAAHCLEGKDIVVEINLGGMTRHAAPRPYPSLAILRELKAVGAPICFSADAHSPENLGPSLDAAEKMARELALEAGYREMRILSGGKWKDVGIEAR
jgi:histidinol-phosphatase (PHP family)